MSDTLYRCEKCHRYTWTPNFSELREVDFEGHIQLRMIPTCPECGADAKRVPALTQELMEVVRP